MSPDLAKTQEAIRRASEFIDQSVLLVAKRTLFGLQDRLIRPPQDGGTPRDTGRAAASWVVSFLLPSSLSEPRTKTKLGSPEGRAKQSRTAIEQARPYDTLWLVNNLPYIQRLNEGWSKQAPAKFVERSIGEILIELEALTL